MLSVRELSSKFGVDNIVHSKYLLKNHYGKHITETTCIRSVNAERPCKILMLQTRTERCQNCTILLQNSDLSREHQIESGNRASHTALVEVSFEELLERYKKLKKS